MRALECIVGHLDQHGDKSRGEKKRCSDKLAGGFGNCRRAAKILESSTCTFCTYEKQNIRKEDANKCGVLSIVPPALTRSVMQLSVHVVPKHL